jgi:hypothetical protein
VYPLVLGVVIHVLGSEAGARALQSVIFSLIVFLICQIVAKQGGSPAIAGLAMLPNYIFYNYTDWLETEIFFTFLSILLLLGDYPLTTGINCSILVNGDNGLPVMERHSGFGR